MASGKWVLRGFYSEKHPNGSVKYKTPYGFNIIIPAIVCPDMSMIEYECPGNEPPKYLTDTSHILHCVGIIQQMPGFNISKKPPFVRRIEELLHLMAHLDWRLGFWNISIPDVFYVNIDCLWIAGQELVSEFWLSSKICGGYDHMVTRDMSDYPNLCLPHEQLISYLTAFIKPGLEAHRSY